MTFPRRFTGCAFAAAVIALAGCAANPTNSLQRVAKDWALTIRASQIIPVYPLREDIRPGDVFLVPTSISEQTSVYEEKGFLPTDLTVIQLENVADDSAYWSGDYGHASYARAAPSATDTCASKIEAPRAAFPTYTFSVNRSAGLQLAVPIQGIPIGLGFMGASRATGTVTIDDSFTYGVGDEVRAYRDLRRWYEHSPDVEAVFWQMANLFNKDIYLRVVTRVYLTCKLDVSLAKIGSVSGGLDAGAAPEMKLLNLAARNPASAAAAASAYKAALNVLSAPLKGTTPGVATRFTQVSGHSVSMIQSFERPLVIGFVGFDVKVLKDGKLSGPIPSFAVLNGSVATKTFASAPINFCAAANPELNKAYAVWLGKKEEGQKKSNFERMKQWLRARGETDLNPVSLGWNCQYQSLLRKAREHFNF